MDKRDYYSVLGVPRSATEEDIRRAYRKLARQYHPDVNKSPDAAAKFTEIQQAYDVLGDAERRKRYDRFGDDAGPGDAPPAGAGRAGRPGGTTRVWTSASGSDFDLDDLNSMFETFFAGRGGGFGASGMHVGAGARGRARDRAGAPERGEAHAELSVDFLTAARGGMVPFRVEAGGESRTIEVRIPRATQDGARLRMRGAAPDGRDLVLTVRVAPHPVFQRLDPEHPLDLTVELPLTIAEATLGTRVTVPTLHGAVEVVVPPGTPSHARLRIKGQGLESAEGKHGDLYAAVRIVTPRGSALSESEREALERIAAKGERPRSGGAWPDAPSARANARRPAASE